MPTRTIHLCLSVRGALLNWPDRDFGRIFKGPDGRFIPWREGKARLLDELANGREVLPLGEPCQGFDYGGGGCPGHETS